MQQGRDRSLGPLWPLPAFGTLLITLVLHASLLPHWVPHPDVPTGVTSDPPSSVVGPGLICGL